MNKTYGFYDECIRRYSQRLYDRFEHCFNLLPLSAIVGARILCMHGGLSPEITSLFDLVTIERPCDIPDKGKCKLLVERVGLVCDLLWADPKRGQVERWCPNERGISYTFNEEVVADFLDKFDLDLICRAHQVVEDGYEFFADMGLVTLCSAPNYAGELDNSGAMMYVSETLVCALDVLRPKGEEMKYLMGDSLLEDDSDQDLLEDDSDQHLLNEDDSDQHLLEDDSDQHLLDEDKCDWFVCSEKRRDREDVCLRVDDLAIQIYDLVILKQQIQILQRLRK